MLLKKDKDLQEVIDRKEKDFFEYINREINNLNEDSIF